MEWITALFIGLPGWIVLAMILGGFCLLNMARGFWFLFMLACIAGFTWFTFETLYATFSMGWPYVLAWGLVIFVLLFGAGTENERGKPEYSYLTFCLLLVFAVSFTLLERNLGLSFVETLVFSAFILPIYVGIGVGVVSVKWKTHNNSYVRRFSEEKRKHFDHLRLNLAKIEEDQKNPRRDERKYNFSTEELQALRDLPSDLTQNLNFVLPEVLKAYWKKHSGNKFLLRKPSLMDASTMALYWVAAWPVELIHFILDDLIVYLWNQLFSLISGWLLAIQEREFKKDPDLL